MDVRALIMGLTFSLMWSSAFATGRVIVAHAPPLAALSLRFAISALLAVAVARALGQTWRLAPAQWRGVVVFGLCQNALYLGLNFVALQRVEASLAAIIASSMPLIVALLGWALRGERVAPLGALGLALGFGGVALIMGGRLSGGADPMGIGLCIAGAVALAWATLTVRTVTAGGNLLMVVGLQMGVGAAILAVVSLATETLTITPGWPLTLAFAYQILVPGLAATLLWFALIGRVGAVKAAAFHFLNPAFGVLIAAALLGEAISLLDVLGVAVAGAGILAVQRARLRGA
ncbi:DMT family transporter [Tabrizicola fusiformis]|uniref:DMT family transporter n=1 Tax=Tabrizicola sp. SY72 TaxID=2741673 RepID=UPI001573D2B7|nr:DMT family transporter [Tabrizicola sp. SY72]NTT84343.1 DMT family transporter [Tabrizicola sp. SY72]